MTSTAAINLTEESGLFCGGSVQLISRRWYPGRQGDLFVALDGGPFVEMIGEGFSGTRDSYHVTTAGRDGDRHDLDVTPERVIYDDVILTETAAPAAVDHVPLPHVRQPLRLLIDRDLGTVLYVSTDRYYDSIYTQGRVFISEGGFDADGVAQLRRIDLRDVQMFRDGGTTIYTTAEDTLHLPAPMGMRSYGLANTWTANEDVKREVSELNLDRFAIQETSGSATVTFRRDMTDLPEEAFLSQPQAPAGRGRGAR